MRAMEFLNQVFDSMDSLEDHLENQAVHGENNSETNLVRFIYLLFWQREE
jgi:hypothetical protein